MSCEMLLNEELDNKICDKCEINYPITNYRKYSEDKFGITCKKCLNELDKTRKKILRQKNAENTIAKCEKCQEEKALNQFSKLKKFYKKKICLSCYPKFLTEQKTAWCKKEHNTNMNYRIKKSLAARLRTVLVKNDTTMNYVGCNIQYLREWFEYNFTNEMNWDNYGTYWSIDHTGTPEITFWKVSYRRHTNFAMESIEQTFSGQADFGRRVTCTISRNGDLAYRTYLQVTLPEINQSMVGTASATGVSPGVYARWLDFIGEQLVAQVEVEIGGQRIDRQYGDWMHIWNQVTMTSEQQRGYFKLIGNTTQLTYMTDPTFAAVAGPCAAAGAPTQVCAPRNALPETTLYIPLLFWFCRNPGLALPLIALQYHEVKINLDLRPIGECLWAVNTLSAVTGTQSVTTAYQQSLVAASLYVDYIFLDTDERRKMAQNPHEYLIEQVQFTGDESVGSSSNKIKLNFNHPVKELIWVVQPDANVDYCSSLDASQLLYRVLGAQPFNYTDSIDALPNAIHAFGGPALTPQLRAPRLLRSVCMLPTTTCSVS
jgi:hypothetical protein